MINMFAVATPSCLPFVTDINVGRKSFSPVFDLKMVRIMRCTIYRNGVSQPSFYFLLFRERELLVTGGSLLCYIFIFLEKKG